MIQEYVKFNHCHKFVYAQCVCMSQVRFYSDDDINWFCYD